jgi:hypothetical protein
MMACLLYAQRFGRVSLAAAAGVALWLTAHAAVTVSIDPASSRTPICPYIYGSNGDIPGVSPTLQRSGGDRLTGYNWENNASNAGTDYLNESDDYLTYVLGLSGAQEDIPGIVLTQFHDQSLSTGTAYSIITLPMAGYVAADKNGIVDPADKAPSARWVAVANTKPTAFTLSPDLNDGKVYNDEMLNFLVSRYGNAASATGIKGYDLDNEPDLWATSHPLLHPATPLCTELITRSVDLAKTVRRIDSTAEILGFVSYGFNGYYNFQNAPDWSTVNVGGKYNWFIDYYLDQMKQASTTNGQRLVDVLDLHNYSEVTVNGTRINDYNDVNNTDPDVNLARLQAPRSFWDATYVEPSYIGQFYSSYLPFLPKIQQSIATYYPGTKLGFGEYNFGGEGHITGGIAEADILGIFGRSGVYLAALWPIHADLSYAAAGMNLYLNYDGAGRKFGDTSVAATDNDTVNTSAYASVESTDQRYLHIILLNKSSTASNVNVNVAGATVYRSARVFAFDGSSAAITERTGVTGISGNQFSYALPALTAAHFVLTTGGGVTADFNGDGKTDLVWSNTTTGDRYVWLMNGTTFASSTYIGKVDPIWRIVGTGDFNGDGKTDIVFENTTTGDRYVWLMNGTTYSSSVYLGNVGTAWHIVGVGDFNSDGKPDLIFENTTTGDRYAWLMNGTTYSSSVYLGNVGTAWHIVGVGDFNSDGKPDLIFENTSTGDRYAWLMNGTTYTSAVFLGNVSTQWHIAGIADFNADGKPDLIFENTSTGDRYVWFMNGTSYSSGAFVANVPIVWVLKD